jgi:hypothetical protein
MMQDRCAVCHWPVMRKGRTIELHHIVGGPGRKNPPDASNWVPLCKRCHTCVHDRIPEAPELSKGAILTAKMENDGPIDLEALAKLRGKHHLGYDPEPLPEFFIQERRKNGGEPWP